MSLKESYEWKNVCITVYIDDVLTAGKEEDIKCIVKFLQEEYKPKDLREVSYYLGINILRTNIYPIQANNCCSVIQCNNFKT